MGENHPAWEGVDGNQPNGPALKILWYDLQFRIKGFLKNTRVRIDLIRQKSTPVQHWTQTDSTMYMPQYLGNFKDLCGFTANCIDTKAFEIIKTRHVYLNSKGASHPIDTATHTDTAYPTTASEKLVHISLPHYNRVVKQLDSSRNQNDGSDRPIQDQDNGTEIQSNYSYDNMNPFSNVWCLITTDDLHDLADTATGDRVIVEVIRRVGW